MANELKSSTIWACTAALAVGTVVGLLLGRSSLQVPTRRATRIDLIDEESEESDEDDSRSEKNDYDNDLKSFDTYHEEFKMILVVRTDLGMTKGSSI
jgi:hypothetical protein